MIQGDRLKMPSRLSDEVATAREAPALALINLAEWVGSQADDGDMDNLIQKIAKVKLKPP